MALSPNSMPLPSKQVALTFDDGPNDPYTLDLLKVLAAHEVKATFFLLGMHVLARPEIARRVAAEGHTIGNHTNTHPDFRQVPFEDAVREIAECEEVLSTVVGPHSRCFRAPFLRYTPDTKRHVAEIGLVAIPAPVQGIDWHPGTPADDIVDRVIQGLAGESAIVLLHDGYHATMGEDRAATVEATDRLITLLKEDGFGFVADPIELSQLLIKVT